MKDYQYGPRDGLRGSFAHPQMETKHMGKKTKITPKRNIKKEAEIPEKRNSKDIPSGHKMLENPGGKVRIMKGVLGEGSLGTQMGDPVFAGQWWTPVLWDGKEDPTFFKTGCLEIHKEPPPLSREEAVIGYRKMIANTKKGSRERKIMEAIWELIPPEF